MGKQPLKGWSVSHLLAVSVAFNVGLVLRLGYNEKEKAWSEDLRDACIRIQSEEMGKGGRDGGSVAMSATALVLEEAEANRKAGSGHGAAGEENDDRIINLDHGDPTMYEKFWKETSDKATIVIPGWQSMSYFSDPTNLCWFMEPKLRDEIIRLHGAVGNAAVTSGKHIVVGTGSTQLFQAALYAMSSILSSSQQETEPVSVVSGMPYYSFYKQVIETLPSRLYKWVGDASEFKGEGAYIEVVTSPNNPDGFVRQPLLAANGGSSSRGMQLHDFAYYWPQYTPITQPADEDVMLFTVSKCTGHAGMRIGWALVKDEEVAKRMVKFIELSSIGVSKDSQLRAAKILQTVSQENFFDISYQLVGERWKMLREVVEQSELFSLPEFPSSLCQYSSRSFQTQPAFAWLKCEGEIEDCADMLKGLKILTRGGKAFGMSPKYVRISMLDRDANFNLFLKRLSTIQLGQK